MRSVLYLSPTSLDVYSQSAEQYYLQYLADDRPPRMLQTPAMAVGSAFDAFAKSWIYGRLYGEGHNPRYDLRSLFEAQVESHNRDVVWGMGEYLFAQYRASGALSDLMLELGGAVGDPRFEFEVRGEVVAPGIRAGDFRRVSSGVELERVALGTMPGSPPGVVLLGKPDIYFINNEGTSVILDWKVNGFLGKGLTSPSPGYIESRDLVSVGINNTSWRYKGCHRDACVGRRGGVRVNTAGRLEDWNAKWASQLATYGWLLGATVGVESVAGVDQFACDGRGRVAGDFKSVGIRIVSHRGVIGSQFQLDTLERYQKLWQLIHSKPFHYFGELGLEESVGRCQMLDAKAIMLRGDLSVDERAALEWGSGSSW